MSKMNVPGYESLADVLLAAYEQAAVGKGKERHANDLPFHEQPMQTCCDLLGTDAGLAFQAIKKLREGSQFEELERWEREALGAINYIAGMVIWRRRQAGVALWKRGAHDDAADAATYASMDDLLDAVEDATRPPASPPEAATHVHKTSGAWYRCDVDGVFVWSPTSGVWLRVNSPTEAWLRKLIPIQPTQVQG